MEEPPKIVPIERLPEELLLGILSYLDCAPPSETNLRDEPSLRFPVSIQHTLKDVSTLSKRWRRLVLPMLFKHTRLRLDQEPPDDWKRCSTCNEKTLTESLHGTKAISKDDSTDDYHIEMVQDATRRTPTYTVPSQPTALNMATSPPTSGPTSTIEIILTWLPRFYHTLKDFLTFLTANKLAGKVESFVLVTEQMLPHKLDRFPHRAAPDRDWRYRCAAAFWRHLLSVIDPGEVVVLAPPTDLACLTNCAIDTFGEYMYDVQDVGWLVCVTSANYFAGDWVRILPNRGLLLSVRRWIQ